MSKLVLGLFFGGKSVEHEISIITASQVLNNLNKSKYNIIPIYISKEGEFYTNPKFNEIKNFKDIDYLLLSSTKMNLGRNKKRAGLFREGIFGNFTPIDIAFPIFHGTYGEDGSIQGLFEMLKIPYVGFGVVGSAVGMDKILSKYLFKSLDLPIIDFIEIKRENWLSEPKKVTEKIIKKVKFPLFVKPVNLGSSIGVNRATDKDSLSFAIEVAFVYSEKVIIEKSIENIKEVNCSVLGYKNPKASVCEMPISTGDILSFADKYISGGSKGSKSLGMASLSRIIPAPIGRDLSRKIQNTSIEIFKAMDGCGVARIDFFVDERNNTFYANEINTIPGSLSYYLWEKSGVKFKDMLDNLVNFAVEREKDREKTQYTFKSSILYGLSENTYKKTKF